MTPILYRLVCKLVQDNNNPGTQYCIMGDRKQSIYDFNKADERYITMAEKLFVFNSFSWQSCKLSQSFRITKPMSEFLNHCMLKEERIFSYKEVNEKNGKFVKPQYYIYDHTPSEPDEPYVPFEIVSQYLQKGYNPDDIFVLAPSIKNDKMPIRKLENKIKETFQNKVPVFVPFDDDCSLDQEIIKNKLVFSTFHQSKGLERKIVIVFGFDYSYFAFYKRNANPNICPNEFYVATTRALEHLILLHSREFHYLPFLQMDKLSLFSRIIVTKPLNFKKILHFKLQKTNPTQMLRHVHQDILTECFNLLEIMDVQMSQECINIPNKIQVMYETTNGSESVCEITGIALPSIIELQLKGIMTIWKELENSNVFNKVSDINLQKLTPENILRIATFYDYVASGFKYKTYQIQTFNWLTRAQFQKCIQRLQKLNLSQNGFFEKPIHIKDEILRIKCNGRIDYIDDNRMFEFKCVQKLKMEHYLQLDIYMYMFYKEFSNSKMEFFLYNILTDELKQIKCDEKTLYKIFCTLKNKGNDNEPSLNITI